MAFDGALRRTHRVIAVLFLLAIPPAGYFSLSAAGGEVSPVVYLPLFPLFGLILTGGYLLVRPWVRRLRANRMPRGQ
jgi:4-amino-4-deoxy-L-arabinose transferase-like glycosyltransferase